MLDSLKRLVLKSSPEQMLETVEQGQRDRTQRLMAEEKSQRDAEYQAQLDRLHTAEHELDQKIARKAELLASIRVQLHDIFPVLAELDTVEHQGLTLANQIVARQIEAGGTLGHHWRDAVLPGCSDLVKRWLRKLEG